MTGTKQTNDLTFQSMMKAADADAELARRFYNYHLEIRYASLAKLVKSRIELIADIQGTDDSAEYVY